MTETRSQTLSRVGWKKEDLPEKNKRKWDEVIILWNYVKHSGTDSQKTLCMFQGCFIRDPNMNVMKEARGISSHCHTMYEL